MENKYFRTRTTVSLKLSFCILSKVQAQDISDSACRGKIQRVDTADMQRT